MSGATGTEPSKRYAYIPERPPVPRSSTVFEPAPGSLLAPTVMTLRPVAGEPSVPSPEGFVAVELPELPAATTTVIPARVALSHATAAGSSGLVELPPKLKLMTCGTGFG